MARHNWVPKLHQPDAYEAKMRELIQRKELLRDGLQRNEKAVCSAVALVIGKLEAYFTVANRNNDRNLALVTDFTIMV